MLIKRLNLAPKQPAAHVTKMNMEKNALLANLDMHPWEYFKKASIANQLYAIQV